MVAAHSQRQSLSTPSKPNLKMLDFEESGNRNTQRKLKTSHNSPPVLDRNIIYLSRPGNNHSAFLIFRCGSVFYSQMHRFALSSEKYIFAALTVPIKILLCVKVLRGGILGKTDTKIGIQ